MCGRYALSLPAGAVRMHVENELQRPVAAWEDEEDYNPARGYNVAPRTRNAVILRGGASDGRSHEDEDHADDKGKADKGSDKVLRIENMQWGLIPHWMKRAPDSGGMLKTINAREDTINEGSSMWKSIRGRKRCIVVAEGFYEWLHKGTERIPYFIKRKDGKLMYMAGLWDSVTYEGEAKPLHTYTIVTTDCNKQMTFLHNRMPAILSDPESIATWLDTSDGQWSPRLANLLKPFEGELEIYPVPREVGKVGTQSADYLKPVSERKGNIASFFAKQSQKQEDKKTGASSSKVPKQSESPDEKASEAFAAEVNEEKSRIHGSEEEMEHEDNRPSSSKQGAQNRKAEAEPEHDRTDLPLNPDEGDTIASASETKGSTSSKPSSEQKDKSPSVIHKKGKRRAIALDDASPEAGDSKKEPIVLSDLESGTDTSAKAAQSKKRKTKSSSKTEVLESKDASTNKKRKKESTKSSQKPKTQESVAKKSPISGTRSTGTSKRRQKEAETDDEGNEKLENFFEIEDDD